MTVQVTNKAAVEIHEHRLGISFEGAAPELYGGYTHKGKKWLPDFAFAKWQHGQPITEISLRGYILKQDGTPSQNRGDITYLTPGHPNAGKGFRPTAPQWLLDLFADAPYTKEG